MTLASDIRGADYRAKAQDALAAARASALSQVRRRHEVAASAWLELAALEERRTLAAQQATAQVAARRAEEARACA